MRLDGRVVLITGAKGGLGTYVTNAFLESGARVVGASRSIETGDFPHASFTALPAELSNGAAARTLVERVIARHGRIDVLAHLVGGFAGGKTVADTDDETLERMLDLNLRTAFHIVRAVLPHMRSQRSGRILAIGSRAGMEPQAQLAAYSASKAALISFMRTVAAENSDANISANVVLPGTMDTPANRNAMPDADYSRWVDPAQVAALLVYLASPQASNITGGALPVYGREV